MKRVIFIILLLVAAIGINTEPARAEDNGKAIKTLRYEPSVDFGISPI